MRKRSVEGYRPIAAAEDLSSGRRFFPESAIEEMIGTMGEPFRGPFALPAAIEERAALRYHLEGAARELAMAREEQRKPTARQLENAFTGIATAARRLLDELRLRPQGKKMPIALLSGGLLPFAHKEAERSQCSAADLVRDAVQGVERLARWADEARAWQARIVRARPATKPNEGDKALDRFVGSVVVNCWWDVFGRKIAVGPKLIAFVQVALRAIGETPTDDAVRDRIRRVLRPQGKLNRK